MKMPNGYGSIVNLGKKRRKPFAVRVTVGYEEKGIKNGVMQYRQKYKYIGYFEKRKEALECLANYNTDPHELQKNTITFAELYEEWSNRKFEKIESSTQDTYKLCFKKSEALHNIPFKDIKTEQMQRVIDANKDLTMIRSFKYLYNQLFKYAIKYDIDKNYAQYLELPAKKDSAPKIPFTNEEIQLFWRNLHIEYVDILLILLYTGLRITELLELKNENIHLNERYFFVEKSKTKAGIRNVPIHKKIAPLIEARINPNNKYFIPNRKGNAMAADSFRKSQFYRLRKKLKFDHTIHETRHTFISQCNRLNLNEVAVQRIIGHANVNITQHYTNKTVEDLVQVIDLFEY